MFKKLLRSGLRLFPIKFLEHLRLEIDYTLGFGSGTGNGSIGLEDEIEFLRQFSKSEVDVIVDIGANEGKWSLAARKIFPNSRIFSFEPNESVFNKLSQLPIFNEGNAFQIGIGSADERKELNFNSSQTLVGSFVSPESMYTINTIQNLVEVRRLETLIAQGNIPIPTFIKIDVEGWELEVIRGIGPYLSQIKFIQFEISEATLIANSSFSKIQEILLDSNFKIYRHSPIGLIEVRHKNIYNENFRTSNYLAVNELTL